MDVAGNGPAAGPTNVPLELPRSSTNHRVPSVVSWACRRLTPGSDERSISGLVFLLVDTRPSRTLRWRRGMIVGSPGEGQGSSASWVWYQSGSTHTSASQSKDSGASDFSDAQLGHSSTAGPPGAPGEPGDSGPPEAPEPPESPGSARSAGPADGDRSSEE